MVVDLLTGEEIVAPWLLRRARPPPGNDDPTSEGDDGDDRNDASQHRPPPPSDDFGHTARAHRHAPGLQRGRVLAADGRIVENDALALAEPRVV